VAAGTVWVTHPASSDGLPRRISQEPAAFVMCGGKEVAFGLAKYAAMWRSLGEVRGMDLAAIRRWVRHYGPLYAVPADLDVWGLAHTSYATSCRELAERFYGPPDATGLSHVVRDFTADALPQPPPFAVFHEGRELACLGDTLLDFAVRAITRKVPLRRCGGCGFWLEATRSTRLYCDSTCRTHAVSGLGLRGRFREESDGFSSQT
jgi:hypothetical protein